MKHSTPVVPNYSRYLHPLLFAIDAGKGGSSIAISSAASKPEELWTLVRAVSQHIAPAQIGLIFLCVL
jgi:hypothetical protein